jgi:thiamine-phosphate pyrophosphorylase
MRARQALPRLWLMTDERQGDGLWRALERLPRGSGVVFRHYRLARDERRRLFEKVRRVARKRRLLLVAGGAPIPGAHPRHGPGGFSASVHDLRELRAAERSGASLVFVSPVFETRSHPGARPLGRLRFGRLARSTGLPVIALGGMGPRKARRLAALGAYGWAGIDAFA